MGRPGESVMSGGLPGNISVNKFRFLNRSYDHTSGEAVLAYSFDDGEAIFERIKFPYTKNSNMPERIIHCI